MEHAGGSFRDIVECNILAGNVEVVIKQQPIEKQETLQSLTQRYNWLGKTDIIWFYQLLLKFQLKRENI